MSTREELAREYVDKHGRTGGSSIATIAAFLAGYDAATEWRDIASAPRDGTEFIGVNAHRERFLLWWSEPKKGFYWNADSEPIEPTHWLPLPQPPARKDTT